MVAPSRSDYLDLSESAYDFPDKTTLPSYYTLVSTSYIASDGFGAEAYRNKFTGDIVITYQGSEYVQSIVDLGSSYKRGSSLADFQIWFGNKVPAALTDAVKFASKVRAAVGSSPIYVTGHSLGGAEAEEVAASSKANDLNIAGGMTFGAPGLPGYLDDSSSALRNNFTNYVDFGDPVGNYASDEDSELNRASATGNHFGKVLHAGDPSDFSVLEAVNSPDYSYDDLKKLLSSKLVDHKIDRYYTDLDAKFLGVFDEVSGEVATNLADAIVSHRPAESVAQTAPTLSAQSAIYTITGIRLYLSPFVEAYESPGSGRVVDHFSVFLIRGAGTLNINGQSVSLGQYARNVTLAQLNVAYFTSPTPGESEIGFVAFDNDGNASDPVSSIISVELPLSETGTVKPTDHTPPFASTQALNTTVGAETIVSNVLLSTVDANTAEFAPSQLTYLISSSPSHGSLVLRGSVVASFTQADVDNNLISYQQDGTSITSDHFTFKVIDPAGNSSGLTRFDINVGPPATATAPVLTVNSAIDVVANSVQLITSGDLHVNDPGVEDWQIVYSVLGEPAGGDVLADGVTPVKSFTQQQVDDGLVSYRAAGLLGSQTIFAFGVSDSSGGSITTNDFRANVVSAASLRVTVDRAIYTDPNGQYVPHPLTDGGIQIGTTPFSTFTSTPGNVTLLSPDIITSVDPGVDPARITYTVKSLPTDAGYDAASILIGQWGQPESSGNTPFTGRSITETDVRDGFADTFTQAEVDAGEVFFRYFGGAGGVNYGDQSSMAVSVADDAGNVSEANLPVVLEPRGILTGGRYYSGNGVVGISATAPINATTTLGNGTLNIVSPQFSSDQLTYFVGSLPTAGTLLLGGVPLAAQGSFTQADVDAGRLTYDETKVAASDSFALWATDPNYPGLTAYDTYLPVTLIMTGRNGGQVIVGSQKTTDIAPGAGNNFLFGDGSTTVDYASSPNPITADINGGTVENGYGGIDTLTDVPSVIGSAYGDLFEASASAGSVVPGLVRSTAVDQGDVLTFSGTGFDATRVDRPVVVDDGVVYQMLYAGLPFGNNYQIGLASSSDGVNWTRSASNPVISNANSQSWASYREFPVSVIYRGGVYHLWFEGDNSNLTSDPGYGSGFGYASSVDGIRWTFASANPIKWALNGGVGNGIDLRGVVSFNNQYEAFYVKDSPAGNVLYDAVSTDGVSFSGDRAVNLSGYDMLAVTTTDYAGADRLFAVVDKGGKYFYATSLDGQDFAIVGQLTLPASFTPHSLLFEGDTLDIYGGEGVGNINWSYGNEDVKLVTVSVAELGQPNDVFDRLTGGAGADTFVLDADASSDPLSPGANPIIVTDYDRGDTGAYDADEGDRLDVSALLQRTSQSYPAAPLASLVRLVPDSATGLDLQIFTGGPSGSPDWTTIADLLGLSSGEPVDLVLDAAGNTAELTYQAGKSTLKEYDATGVLTDVVSDDIAGQRYIATDAHYGADGKVATIAYMNAAGGLYALLTYASDGSFTIQHPDITGQPYTTFTNDYAADSSLVASTYGGFAGEPYASKTATYAPGTLTTLSTIFYRADGSVYVIQTRTPDGGFANLHPAVTSQPYTAFTATYTTGDVLVGSSYTGYTSGSFDTEDAAYAPNSARVFQAFLKAGVITKAETFNADGSVQTVTNYALPAVQSVANQGLFEKVGTADTWSVANPFASTGAVDVESGILKLTQGAMNGGVMDVGAYASIQVAGALTGTGTVNMHGAGSVFELAGSSDNAFAFTDPSAAVLMLDDPADFTGHIQGFGSNSVLDLKGFSGASSLNYTPGQGGGTLTVTDGTDHASLAFLGNYALADFARPQVDQTNTGILIKHS